MDGSFLVTTLVNVVEEGGWKEAHHAGKPLHQGCIESCLLAAELSFACCGQNPVMGDNLVTGLHQNLC